MSPSLSGTVLPASASAPHRSAIEPVRLPPPLTEPIRFGKEQPRAMPGPHRALAAACLREDDKVYLAVRSGTRVDVGYWFVNARVAVLATEDALLMAAPVSPRICLVERLVLLVVCPVLALLGLWYEGTLAVVLGVIPPIFALVRVRAGRGLEPVALRLPFTDLKAVRYNHVTGRLMLGDRVDRRFANLRMPPVEAYQIMAQIHAKVHNHA